MRLILGFLTVAVALVLSAVAPTMAGTDAANVGSASEYTVLSAPPLPPPMAPLGPGSGINLFSVEGEPVSLHVWNRTSVWDWNFFPATNKPSGPGSQNSYNFEANVLKLGLLYHLDGVTTYAEMENPTLIGVPDQAIDPKKGPMGFGGFYYLSHQNAVDSNVFLKQGWTEFGDQIVKGLDIKGGRIEFLDGTEIMPEDPQLRWLVGNEIMQRLIGNFVFPSDVGRSFDGATVRYGTPAWNATVFYGVPTKGVFDLNGMDEISSIDTFYASLNAGPNQYWGNSVGRVFYIWYDDNRGLRPADNSASKCKALVNCKSISIDTIGADLIHTWNVGPGIVDFLVWGAYQFGSWGDQAQQAYSYIGALGYRFTEVPWQPWLRAEYTFGSGDSNPKNDVHGTFFQILPTPRFYALDPIYNMMNNMDLAGQLILNPIKDLEWRSDIDALWLASSHDLWYAGGGAYSDKIFGYLPRPSNGKSYLGTVVDSGIDYKVNKNLFLRFYGGHMFGGSVVGALYPDGRGETFAFAVAILTI